MLILLHLQILRKEMRANILTLEIELPPQHDLLPVVHHFDLQILSEEVDLLYLFVFFDLLCEFADRIELVLVVVVIGYAS